MKNSERLIQEKYNGNYPTCKCGCGENTIYDPGRKDFPEYKRGHQTRVIKDYFGDDNSIKIHNTSWGFQHIHVTFKEKLDLIYDNVLHSDIIESSLPKTQFYDITKQPDSSLVEQFDVVINVSTVEEVDGNHLTIIENLFSQVKQNGILIITFDLPGFQITDFESYVNTTILTSDNDISGNNSVTINTDFSHLNCGILIIKKL